METNRRSALSEDDVQRIADAVTIKTRAAFFIDDEEHYNSHKKLDRMLGAYESATNIFIKTFLGFVIVGSIMIAGFSVVKGLK